MINQKELEMGDLIFYVSPGLDIVEHTAIYLGEKEGVIYVLHATKEPYKSIMVTQLKNSLDAMCKYRVMRPMDKALAIEAIVILLRWVEYQVPYASKEKVFKLMSEAEKLFSFELINSASQQAEFGRKNYRENYSQYLDMLNALPYVTEVNGKVEGFGCAESIVLAFNLALLIRHSKQDIIADGSISWQLDNYSNLEEFLNNTHNPLPFDARFSLSAGLYYHCETNPEDWLYIGELYPETNIVRDQESKEIWKAFKEVLRKRSPKVIESRKSSSVTPQFICNQTSPNVSLVDVISFATSSNEDNFFRAIDSPPLIRHHSVEHDNKEVSTRIRGLSLDENPIAFFFLSPSKKNLKASKDDNKNIVTNTSIFKCHSP